MVYPGDELLMSDGDRGHVGAVTGCRWFSMAWGVAGAPGQRRTERCACSAVFQLLNPVVPALGVQGFTGSLLLPEKRRRGSSTMDATR